MHATAQRQRDAYSYCRACHTGARESVSVAMRVRREPMERCRRPTTARARTRVGVGERRSSGSPDLTGPRRVPSRSGSAAGPSLTPRRGAMTRRCRETGSTPIQNFGSSSISLPKPPESINRSGHRPRQQGRTDRIRRRHARSGYGYRRGMSTLIWHSSACAAKTFRPRASRPRYRLVFQAVPWLTRRAR